ncbi:MAG: sigma-70 family RNA polymerase sigma factor [Saprospiraceae bacterium]|nr:sigma-70 family RNA polymerase sigma factor [Saprospiraceae bacterium]
MKTIQMTTPDLLGMLLSGDQRQQNQALKQLFTNRMINAKVQEWAKMYNLREKSPDDVLQEAVILLYDMVLDKRFRGASKVETFLLGICLNLIRDSGKKVNRVQYKESFTDAEMYSEDSLADAVTITEQTNLEQERDKLLEDTMGQLTPNCQESLKLYYFKNKSMTDIAAARLLANAEQAKKAVHRCRESLRNLVKENNALQNIINQLS